MFLDEAVIDIHGGHGGNGCVAWRREKFVPRGGPAGGDGGRGGNVYFIADPNVDTLSDYASRKVFKADPGESGAGSRRHGRDGEDLYLKVPPGTMIAEVDGDFTADLVRVGDTALAASGGRGGYGNAHFASSVRQSPDFAELGEEGFCRKLKLELKMVADVGIIGYPSVGKSTLISVISSAKPKIADYPFTTLVPNLGVVTVDDRSYVVCDVPGLIEGASEGKGLGHQFLKHVERCGFVLHVLDAQRGDADQLKTDYETIREELRKYSPTLAHKRELIVLNKIDLLQEPDTLLSELRERGIDVMYAISAATTKGTKELSKQLLPLVLEERQKRVVAEESIVPEIPVLTPHVDDRQMSAFTVEQGDDGSILIKGARIEQMTKMTNFSSEGGVRRFRDICERSGLLKALKRERKNNESVFIGEIQVDSYL